MSDNKSPVVKLYEYCQSKSNNISLSDLKFEYEIKPKGKFNCIIIINGETFKKDDLSCNSKREAKNQIADYTYKKLIERDNKSALEDNRNPVIKLNEYCQDKNTKINLSDIEFLYDINTDGSFNCKIKINDQIYDQKLKCKSKKAAKNAIAEHVYSCLISLDKKNNIFNEKVLEQLSYNNIKVVDLFIHTMECENNKFICIIEFDKIKNKTFMAIEPRTKEKLNEDFLNFLKDEDEFIYKGNNPDNEVKELNFDYYIGLFKITYTFIIEKGKKHTKCRCEILGIVVGEEKIQKSENENDEQIKTLITKTKNRATITLRTFSEQNFNESIYPKYQNDLEIEINGLKMIDIISDILKKLNNNEIRSNNYIQNIAQNFISSSSKKEEKRHLNDINNIITEIMNEFKRKENLAGGYLIKKINNYEVWNIINYEIILYVEFKIEYIQYCYNTIKEKLVEHYEDKIMEKEFDEKSRNIRLRLINGSTFLIYVGTSIYDELLSKYVTPFYNCLDIERKYIQFVILWSNLVLYDFPKNKSVIIIKDDGSEDSENLSSFYLKEQERIFTTLALYSWDYMSKNINKNDKRKTKNLYIYSLTLLVKMIIHYRDLRIKWDEKKDMKFPYLIDPVSNRNLITSNNRFIWETYRKYYSKLISEKNKINLLPDEEEEEESSDNSSDDETQRKNNSENNENNNMLKIYFVPHVTNPQTFEVIKKVYFNIIEDEEITVKTSLYHIPDILPKKNKELLNIVFNSLQSFLLLNIYNIKNSIQIQNLNNEKNDEKFKELNNKLKGELFDGIPKFFKILNKNITIKLLNERKSRNRSSEINKLYFILGNNNNVSIDILVEI